MTKKVECTVCGATIGRGPQGLGLISHSLKHRREFKEIFGRQPANYDEVREKLGSSFPPPQQATLWEALTDDEQDSLREVFLE